MDEPTTLTELLTLEGLTRAFWPSGLSGTRMQPEDSLRYLRDSIALARLVDEVPEEVRKSFERVRKTYLYGLAEYDLFTVADDDARPDSRRRPASPAHRLLRRADPGHELRIR